MSPAAHTADLAILAYRRWGSPRTPACAYRVHAGGCSCSSYGRRAIRRAGFRRGLELIRRRTRACRAVAAAAGSIMVPSAGGRDTRKRRPRRDDGAGGWFGEILSWIACSALFESFSCSS